MHKFLLVLLILLAACAPVSAPQPSASQGGNNNQTTPVTQPVPSLPATQENPTLQPSSGEAATAQPTSENPGSMLWVKVTSHQDGDTVNTPVITLKGQAPTDAVVTVNDEVILVAQDQTFETQVKLDEGPNLIEIVASDLNGNEVYLPFTLEYEP